MDPTQLDSVSPGEFEAPDSGVETEGGHDAADAAAVDSAAPSPVKRESVFDDPVVKWLSIGLGVTVVLFLSTILAALYLGVLGSDTPRTALERDLQAYEYQTSQGDVDPELWRKYVAALIQARQFRRAEQAIERGRAIIDNNGADMTFSEAELRFQQKRYEEAIETATEGMNQVQAYFEKQSKDPEAPEFQGGEVNQNYWGMLYIRANSYVALEQYDKAIADYDEYLQKRAGASDVYVLRGDAKAASGDNEGAEKDYRKALVFIEDYAGALEGLEKLGVKP